MNDTPRTIPWGTITCGFLAVLTAVLVGLVQLGGVAIPFRTLGPGTIVGLGVLILLTGLVVMVRSNARELRTRATAPVPPLASRPQTAERITETPAAQGAAEGPSEQGHGEAQSNH